MITRTKGFSATTTTYPTDVKAEVDAMDRRVDELRARASACHELGDLDRAARADADADAVEAHMEHLVAEHPEIWPPSTTV